MRVLTILWFAGQATSAYARGGNYSHGHIGGGESSLDLIEQGCDLVLIDNWSTDATFQLMHNLHKQYPNRIAVEQYPVIGDPGDCAWRELLQRKETIALDHPGRWIIHTDADEIRRSPFRGLKLREAFERVTAEGFNRVNFTVFHFRPVAAEPFTSMRNMRWFERGHRPGHFVQWKAWLQPQERVDLASSGGHQTVFSGRADYPVEFILKHYPLRSREHGLRKLAERRQRWSKAEREAGWHHHYDNFDQTASFEWSVSDLTLWDEFAAVTN